MNGNLAIVEKKPRATGSNPWLLDIHAIGLSFTIDSVHNMVICLLRTRKQLKKKGVFRKIPLGLFLGLSTPWLCFLLLFIRVNVIS